MTEKELQDKIEQLSQSNAKMFDTIVSWGEQLTHFENIIAELRKENEGLKSIINETNIKG